MPSHDRRTASGRRTGSRGPKILRFEPLEGRQLLSSASVAQAPDLAAVSLQTDAYGDWGEALNARAVIRNQGQSDVTQTFRVEVYVSSSPEPDASAVQIGSIDVLGLKAGEQVEIDEAFDLPPQAVSGVGADGAIYIGLIVDTQNSVAERYETNNYNVGRGIDSSLVLISPKAPASLVSKSLTIDRTSALWGQTITVKTRIENSLGGHAPASTARIVLTPPGAAPGGPNDVTLVGDLEVPELLPYQSMDITGQVTLPPGPPPGFSTAGAMVLRVVPDADHDVNPVLEPTAPQGRGIDWEMLSISPDPTAPPPSNDDPASPAPDLSAADVLTPGATLSWGQSFQVAATIKNTGDAASGPLRIRYLLAGPNGETANALVLGDATLDAGLAPGAEQAISRTLKLPGKLPFGIPMGDGLGRILVQVDPENTITESDEANNGSYSVPMTLQLPNPSAPNLPGQSPTNPPNQNPNGGGTQNPGGGPAPGTPRPAGNPSIRQARMQMIQQRREQLQALREAIRQRRIEAMQVQRPPLRLHQQPGFRVFPRQGP